MLTNRLKLSDDKTEFLKFLPQPHPTSFIPESLLIGSDHITTSTKAKNLEVLLDPSLTLSSHITLTCKSANYQLYCLSRIKRYLSPGALKTAIHALISSKLDYCNSLLVGLPKSDIQKYQHIMNSAVCMISGYSKYDHIFPVLADLHWLPIEYWVNFKLLCLTYKALHGLAPAYIADLLKLYSPTSSFQEVWGMHISLHSI